MAAHPLIDRHDLMGKWGLVSERTSEPEFRDAIRLVLGYESDGIDTGPFFDLPADLAHARACRFAGQVEGIEIAMEALTDPTYIAQQREGIKEQIQRAKEQDPDGRPD